MGISLLGDGVEDGAVAGLAPPSVPFPLGWGKAGMGVRRARGRTVPLVGVKPTGEEGTGLEPVVVQFS